MAEYQRMADTEKSTAIVATSLSDMCKLINYSIAEKQFIYKCEVTIDSFPKTKVEYTIKWLSPQQNGIMLAQFVECSQPMRISLPLRIWTIL